MALVTAVFPVSVSRIITVNRHPLLPSSPSAGEAGDRNATDWITGSWYHSGLEMELVAKHLAYNMHRGLALEAA